MNDPQNRFICTRERPWRGKADGEWVLHPDASELPDSQKEGWPAGDTVTMHCPHCGHRWEKELPQ